LFSTQDWNGSEFDMTSGRVLTAANEVLVRPRCCVPCHLLRRSVAVFRA
jgi:hypothetical protein